MSNIEQSIVDLKESLEREIGVLKQDMHQGFSHLNDRFDTQAARLERHASLWETGARLEAKDRELAELRERLIKLERKSA